MDEVLAALNSSRGGPIIDVEKKAATDNTWEIITKGRTTALSLPEQDSNLAIFSAYISKDKANQKLDSVLSVDFPLIARGEHIIGSLSNI
jgi:hypothetical protein